MAWWDDYFKDVDSFDIDRVARWFDDNVELRFANWPASYGKDAVVAALADFWTNIRGLSHATRDAIPEGSRVCAEADVTYIRLDERKVTVRAATVLNRADGKITAIHAYVDVTPIFAS